MRAFLAIELPETVKKEIFALAENLINRDKNIDAKIVEEENLHLTLKFFGEISAEELARIKNSLKLLKAKAFNASLGKTGLFPSESFVRVVWVSLEPAKIINELHLDIDSILKKNNFNEDKNFKSHITLARIKRVKNKEEFLKKLSSLKIKSQEFKISSFALKKSTLTAKGPVYETLAEFKLI